MRYRCIAKKSWGRRFYSREDCGKCYGRGYVGFFRTIKGNIMNANFAPVLCKCVREIKVESWLVRFWKKNLDFCKHKIVKFKHGCKA